MTSRNALLKRALDNVSICEHFERRRLATPVWRWVARRLHRRLAKRALRVAGDALAESNDESESSS